MSSLMNNIQEWQEKKGKYGKQNVKEGDQCLWWGVVNFSVVERRRQENAVAAFFCSPKSPDLGLFFWKFLFQVGRLLFPPHILLLKCQVDSDGDRGVQHFWVTAVTMLLTITARVPFFFSSIKIFLPSSNFDTYFFSNAKFWWRQRCTTDNLKIKRQCHG